MNAGREVLTVDQRAGSVHFSAPACDGRGRRGNDGSMAEPSTGSTGRAGSRGRRRTQPVTRETREMPRTEALEGTDEHGWSGDPLAHDATTSQVCVRGAANRA